jgi:hypothetical protein
MKKVITSVIVIATVLLITTCLVDSTDGTIDAPVVTGTSPTFDTTPTWEWTIPDGAVKFRYRLDLGNWQIIDSLSVTSYTPSSPLARGMHVLEVQAADSDNNWSASGSHIIFIALETPTGVSASDNIANKIMISWNSVSDAAAYYVYRSLSPDADYSEIGENAGVSYEDTTAVPGTTYYYKVRAKSANNIYSDYSEYDEGQAAAAPSGPGTCSMLPQSVAVDLNDQFTTEIHVDTGSQNIAAYSVDILFDSNIIIVNTGVGANGVSPGSDGFVTAVNASLPGILQINGFDVTGEGPGSNLHLVTINWTAVGTGATDVIIEVEVLVDSSYVTIGTPAGISNTVTVN